MHTLLLRGVGSGAGGAWAGRSAALANWRDESNVSTDAVYAPDAAHDPLAVEVALRDIDECGEYVALLRAVPVACRLRAFSL